LRAGIIDEIAGPVRLDCGDRRREVLPVETAAGEVCVDDLVGGSDADRSAVRRWLGILRLDLVVEDGGVRETLSVLAQIMKTAMKARVIRENPAAGHSMPTARKRTKVLTMQQVDLLVERTDERYRTAVWLLALAGLRPSELCGLRVMDVDFDQQTISVNEVQMWVKGELIVKGPKTASGLRTIPLPDWLILELAAQIARRAKALGHALELEDRVFVSPEGKAMLDHTLWRIVSRACDQAGLPRIRPYDLRHSHASLLIDLGAHPKAISERMGHTEIGVTMNVYGHLYEGKQRELTADLDGLLDRTRSKDE
jgi:integrase